MKKCEVCKIEFEAKRETAKYCSPKCRVTASRQEGVVSDGVQLSEPVEAVVPEFRYIIKHLDQKTGKWTQVGDTRTAIYWYDVPLAAIPVYEKGWPKMPEPLNGRQYFLWWKNEFKTSEDGKPVILNPFPPSDKPVEYIKAGEGSRHWGTN